MPTRDWLLVPLYVVVAGAGLFWGGRNTLRTLHNLSPVELDCAEFVAHPPDADWVRLDRCELDLSHVSTPTHAPRPRTSPPTRVEALADEALDDEADFRARPAGTTRPYTLVISADHGVLLDYGSQPANRRAPERMRAWLAQEPIEGLVEHGIDRNAADRRDLRDALFLPAQFAIIDWQARPRPLWLALPALGLGLAAFAMLARWWRRCGPVLAKATLISGGHDASPPGGNGSTP
jgi:hypothetical protein